MNKTLTMLFFAISLSASLMASQKYNPQSGKWETVPQDWQNKYNPHEGTWTYQPKDAKTVYNPYEGTWDWNSGHNSD